ncbi:hypothetical protein [Nocardia salmonicida]|uniref:hypothetical protein n=1 Tax=Nocardia salmonicida TaxID=53431 RepID=UPI0033DF5DCA
MTALLSPAAKFSAADLYPGRPRASGLPGVALDFSDIFVARRFIYPVNVDYPEGNR